ncbi:MAG: isoamylase early set domain-containing protein, partial [Candidatus Omnitrophica bacterium]|nr:isoamylase early set domain-containing protein [Candidatus Omnitrophota bacterium]
ELPKICEVVFSVSAPQAQEVYLAGDFNDWKLDANSRMQQHNGIWSKSLKLRKGRYRYRFVVDGRWIEDINNPSKEVNPYGSVDSLLEVI